MKKLLILELLILAFVSVALGQTTYTWNGDVTVRDSGSGYSFAGLVVAQNVTSISIVTTFDTGCATDIVVVANVTSGPTPIVGEYLDAPNGFQKGIFKIVNVVTNADGSLNLTLNQETCEGFPVLQGTATVGPAFRFALYFPGYPGIAPGRTCASNSTASFDYLDASGNLQTATASSGQVTCTLVKAPPDLDSNGQYGVDIQNGSFSGLTTEGTSFNAAFTLDSDQQGRSNIWYAKGASWTVTYMGDPRRCREDNNDQASQ